ncbi:hypothetical protein AOLI_G00077240 [Acnodon oligacanthus]
MTSTRPSATGAETQPASPSGWPPVSLKGKVGRVRGGEQPPGSERLLRAERCPRLPCEALDASSARSALRLSAQRQPHCLLTQSPRGSRQRLVSHPKNSNFQRRAGGHMRREGRAVSFSARPPAVKHQKQWKRNYFCPTAIGGARISKLAYYRCA